MKKKYFLLLLVSLILSCKTRTIHTDIPEQGVQLELPKGWFYDYSLNSKDSLTIGEFNKGVIEPKPFINCKEFMNRLINEGDNFETDKDGYFFNEEEGGDRLVNDNYKLKILEINGTKIYRASSTVTNYGEDETESNVCKYCVELSLSKILCLS